MNRLLLITVTFLTALVKPLTANVIASQTFNFGVQSNVQATVTATVLDNYHGDFTRQDWTYTVLNLSYLSYYQQAFPLGVMSFGTFPYADEHASMLTGDFTNPDPYILDNIVGPWSFCRSGCDLQGAWSTFQGSGLLLGQSATFEFSVYAPPGWQINVQTGNAYLSSTRPSLSLGPYDPINGPLYVPQLTQTSEPGTLLLGLFGIATISAYRASRSWIRSSSCEPTQAV